MAKKNVFQADGDNLYCVAEDRLAESREQRAESGGQLHELEVHMTGYERSDKALQLVEEAAKDALQLKKNAVEVALRLKEAADKALELVRETAKETLRQQIMAAEVLQEEKVVAEAATSAKSLFLANMSHELRTPMAGVLGMLNLVLAGNLEAEQREFIDIAHTSALSLVRILNDILDLTRIETGNISIEAKPFSMRKCVEDVHSCLLPVAKIKGLDLDFNVDDDVPGTSVGDQTRINQILTNLVGNAVKFTEKGGVELRVAAGGSESGGTREVTLTVIDTGIGIRDDKKNLLFHAFSQVDESHSRIYGGAGLGLVISKELVERMGGTITFTSEEGKGSTFFCTIPLGEAKSGCAAIITTDITATAWDAPRAEELTKPRLLVAEDDHVIRRVLGKMFQRVNYEIAFAENGPKVVEMWESGKYDLILMDVQMPFMNGFEATAAIREKERAQGIHIPIIAMTAHASKADEERCLNAGMDAYISKPIDFKKCLILIDKTFKTRQRFMNVKGGQMNGAFFSTRPRPPRPLLPPTVQAA